jgi:hypothetical protein
MAHEVLIGATPGGETHHPWPNVGVRFRLSAHRGRRSLGEVRRWLPLIAVAAGFAASPAHAASVRQCGLTARIDGERFEVDVVKGPVACKTARRVATTFLRKGTIAPPWHCFRGHESQGQDWAASCSRGKSLFRVWPPT